MEPLLLVEGYSWRAGRQPILREVGFSLRRGEFLSLIGPNGAGKSTLLKCLMRILPPGEGRVTLAGRPLGGYGQRQLARLVSYVPQAGERSFPFSVEEFVSMGRYPHLSPFSSPGPEDRRAVEEALALTGTAPFRHRRLNTLSGGERQKVLIAAALAQGAELMLLDEPTTFLDPRQAGEVDALLRRVNREGGATVVSVTHDVNSAIASGGRVLALVEGAVAYSGTAAGVAAPGVLGSIYGGEFLVAPHPATGEPVVFPGGGR